jgi:2-polyprenyl-3-methyl-5-hydroxy-6-metoxy-1,4-benzoquinol methylase
VHRISGTAGSLARGIGRLLASGAGTPERAQGLRVADLAAGGGELTLDLARSLARRGLVAEVTGVDMSPVAVARANGLAAQRGAPVRFVQHDLVSAGLPRDFDLFVSSLFVHHLPEPALQRLFAQVAERARLGCVFHDLDRTRLGYLLASVGPHLLGRSHIAQVDGQLSVRAALRPAEVLELAVASGLSGARVERCFPERWQLSWKRADGDSPAHASK